MNIVNKLTLRQLKTNKGRSVITTLGIIISVAMITAVFVAAASFFRFFGDVDVLMNGNRVVKINRIDEEMLNKLKSDDRVKSVGTARHEELCFDLGESYTPKFRSGSILTVDQEYAEQIVTTPFDGKLPTNASEIAIEESFIEDNKLSWKLGEEIVLPLGTRTIKTEDGSEDLYGLPYIKEESFQSESEAHYTITAILHGNYPTYHNYAILRGVDKGASLEHAYAGMQLKKLNYNSRDELLEILNGLGLTEDEYVIDNDLLEANFSLQPGSTFSVFLPAIIFLLLIIIIASVTLIYNAFAMSLGDRVRYLGMLASVGATKAQKRGSIYFEGFILGCIGIPIGILSGIAGIAVTLRITGEKIVATGMIMNVSDANLHMKCIVPPFCIVLIILFSIFTIFLSALVPARKASQISAIDAIRRREEIKVKAKNLKAPALVRLIFGYEGELAYKNQKRNGRKGRVITVSMILSMVLFLSVNYFCEMFAKATDLEGGLPYQLGFNCNYEHVEILDRVLAETEGVDDFYTMSYLYRVVGGEDTAEGMRLFTDKDFLNEKYQKLTSAKTKWMLYFVDDDRFKDLCKKQNIDAKPFFEGNLKAILLNQVEKNGKAGKVYKDTIVGKMYTLPVEFGAENPAEVTIAALADYDDKDKLCDLKPEGAIALYMPLSSYLTRFNEEQRAEFQVLKGVDTKTHEQTCEAILEALDEAECPIGYDDYVESMQMMNTITFVLQVFLYGFITLITLITIANIVNTVSTGMLLRKKEFAMLQSVGMTPKGFRKMITLESLLYGIRAVLIGLPLSIAISYWMNRSVGGPGYQFEIDFATYGATILVIFLIVGVTMFYSVQSLKNDSIVGTLKQEINE